MTFTDLSSRYHHVRRRNIMLQLIRNGLRVGKGALACDVGCGEGWYTVALRQLGFSVLGIDISKKRLKQAKIRMDADFVVGDANKMPFKDNTFDLTICAQLLEHLPTPSIVVGECKRILKDRGVSLFEVPSKSNIIDILIRRILRMDRAPWTTWGLTIGDHIHFFGQEDLLEVFSTCGFKIIKIRGVVALRYTLPMLSHMFWDSKRRWWHFLDLIEGIISLIPVLGTYGAIQTFLVTKANLSAELRKQV